MMATVKRALEVRGGSERGGGPGGGRRLERRNALDKGIRYDSSPGSGSGRQRKGSDPDPHFDDPDGSGHYRNYSLDEYRVFGRDSVEEMNNVCKFLGLPDPASLGIPKDLWGSRDIAKWHIPGGVSDADSITSYAPEDPSSEFTFDTTTSPGRSDASTSPQDRMGDSIFGIKETTLDQYQEGDVSPSARSLRNDADAADLSNFIDRHGDHPVQQERQSHRFPFPWNRRSASLPAAQNRPMSPRTPAGYPRTSGPLSKMFNYSEPPVHIHRAQSHPEFSPRRGEPDSTHEENPDLQSALLNLPVPPVVLQVEHRGSRETSRDHEGNANTPSVVTREVVLPSLEAAPSRSSIPSDGSGELTSRESPRHGRTDELPEGSSFVKQPSVGREKAVAILKPGSLTRPPPLLSLMLPDSALPTRDLLDGLGPPPASVAHNDQGELSEDDNHSEENENEEGSKTGVAIRQPEGNQIADSSRDGSNLVAPSPPIDKGNGMEEDKPSERESNAEPRNGSRDVQESTTLLTQKMTSIDLTPSPDHTAEMQRDYEHMCDEARVQTLVFPWSKGDLLGQGSFGTVYEAVDSNGSFFAVKEVSLTETDKNSLQCISQLEQEIELLSRFKHENIVQYLGTQRADGKLYIFLELVSKGALASLCKKFKLTQSHIVAYTRQILKGLKYLHDMNIVHRDIKCANILVDVKGTCKLADFGLAKQISALDQLKSCKGSAYWMAPEVIDPKKTYWLPADIWSLGCCVLEMATGNPPFGDQEWYRVLWKVGHGEAPPIPEELSETAKDFIGRCLEINPAKRPTATELLQHPFVANNVITPTSSGQLSPQLVASGLQTITEERTGDFAGSSGASYRASSLSNGHSDH